MIYLISIMPGLSFACFVFLFIIGIFQHQVYRRTGYQSSKDLSTFCFFASSFAAAPFVAHSRTFSPEFQHIYVLFSVLSLCISTIYYLKAINYFITVPKKIYRWVLTSSVLLSILAFLAIPIYFFFSYSVYFNPNQLVETSNFFVNSYTNRIGATRSLGMGILSLSGLINSLFALYLLRIVLKSSRDVFFIIGLSLTILSSILENALLPFTLQFFFPVVFLSNLFEAFRMNHLIHNEYCREKALKEISESSVKNEVETEKYKNSNLNEDRIVELAGRITSVFEKDKIFMNPNLNSEQLSRAIGIPSYQISQVINIGLRTTFFDLLSFYRIEEVKRRLADPQFAEQNIIDIAYECGFNSKSAFNTAFKKYTNMTPSTYRTQLGERTTPLDSLKRL